MLEAKLNLWIKQIVYLYSPKSFLIPATFSAQMLPSGKNQHKFQNQFKSNDVKYFETLVLVYIYIYKSRIVFCITYIITYINIYIKIYKNHTKNAYENHMYYFLSIFFSVIFILFCQLIRRFIRLDLSLGVYVRCFDFQYREVIDISHNDVIICFKRMFWKKFPKAFHIE